MTPCFKKYLIDSAKGALIGSTFGATCGSAAGAAGLDQVCWSQGGNTLSCLNTLSVIKGRAAGAGAGAGAAVGFLVGGLVYPAYKGFMGWLKPNMQEPIDFKHVVSDSKEKVSVITEVVKIQSPTL